MKTTPEIGSPRTATEIRESMLSESQISQVDLPPPTPPANPPNTLSEPVAVMRLTLKEALEINERMSKRRSELAAKILCTLLRVTNSASHWNAEKSVMEGPTYSWIVAGDVEASYVRQAYKYADELLKQESAK